MTSVPQSADVHADLNDEEEVILLIFLHPKNKHVPDSRGTQQDCNQFGMRDQVNSFSLTHTLVYLTEMRNMLQK
jgi:hypothetical protein